VTTVSVAMATYNGERYLLEQLESIAHQTRVPDEVVISDDGSTDKTVEIARRWAQTAPMAVRWLINEARLGCCANFDRALAQTTGDIVCLSDQDDVWLPWKIARVLEEFKENPKVLLVLNNQRITTHELRDTGWTTFRRHNAGHGCCVSARRQLLELALPIPCDCDRDWVNHDHWLIRLATVLNRKQLIEEPLQLYRRHRGAFGIVRNQGCRDQDPTNKKRTFLSNVQSTFAMSRSQRTQSFQRTLKEIDEMLARLTAPSVAGDDTMGQDVVEALSTIQREQEALHNRLILLNQGWIGRRTGSIRLLKAGDYNCFGRWKSFLRDFLGA